MVGGSRTQASPGCARTLRDPLCNPAARGRLQHPRLRGIRHKERVVVRPAAPLFARPALQHKHHSRVAFNDFCRATVHHHQTAPPQVARRARCFAPPRTNMRGGQTPVRQNSSGNPRQHGSGRARLAMCLQKLRHDVHGPCCGCSALQAEPEQIHAEQRVRAVRRLHRPHRLVADHNAVLREWQWHKDRRVASPSRGRSRLCDKLQRNTDVTQVQW